MLAQADAPFGVPRLMEARVRHALHGGKEPLQDNLHGALPNVWDAREKWQEPIIVARLLRCGRPGQYVPVMLDSIEETGLIQAKRL